MPDIEQDKKDSSPVPPDMAGIGSFLFMILAVLFVSCGLSWAKRGDTTLFNLAVFLGAIGAVLLLIARIPLYRQRRFFTLGPRALTGIYRKLYFAAYVFIVPSIVLLVLLLLSLR
jgi:hypothetical protein